ncbi:MAG TPA: ABC transporter ATP-binding protein [Candidatus Merdenecus merdavium]|nr:ABC transporter ATP-binding protein [Candidatus Merdenecus merdavium]
MIVKDISFSYGDHNVLNHVSFSVKEKKITTIMGANGCGKTTLFNVMTRNLKDKKGSITLKGKEIETYKLKEFAREVAIVHQYNTAWSDTTVEKLVSLGRVPYMKLGRGQTDEDESAVQWAMEVTGVKEYKDQPLDSLSGGQKQRAWIAMAIAQKTKILFLDEPTTYLDIRYQIEILHLIKKLNEEYGITIIMILHDINQAMMYSDYIIGLKDGQAMVQGVPKEALTKENIRMLYGVDLEVGEVNGKKVVLTA